MTLDIWRIVLQWQGGRRRHPRGAVSLPVSRRRRREKTPEERTGEVRPASRARNQAHEPRRRDTPARAGTGARRIRANQGPAAGRPDGTEWNETGWRNDMQECENGARKRPRPLPGRERKRRPKKPSPAGRGLGEGPQAGEGKKGASGGGRQARPYDRTGDRICARSMPIMTFHDISREGRRPPGPLPVIPPYRHARTCSGQPYGRAAEAVEVDARNKSGHDGRSVHA